MKKPNIITVVIIAAVLLLAVCIGPLIDHISYELRYGTWEYHIDLAGEDRFVLQDYKAAFDHAADAYNSLPTENDIDRDLLSSTCLYMAECLEMIGDSELLVDVLERGYEDTGDSSIYAKLSACPVTFVNKNFLAAVCASVGVDEDALTYADLQRVEEISISSNSIFFALK